LRVYQGFGEESIAIEKYGFQNFLKCRSCYKRSHDELISLIEDIWAARRFGQLKAQLEQMGEIISDPDLQIASIALDQDAALVTHNQEHFFRLTNLAGLVLEDWLA
jgi:predicted nucleic acid-binding protein